MAASAPVPGAPPALRGLLDLRGEVVPVLDARAALGGSPGAPRPDEHLLLVEAAGRRVALAVDRVMGVRELPEAERTGAGGARAVRMEEGVVVVLPAAAWLARAGGALAAGPPVDGATP